MNTYEPQAKFFRALMHPARLAILEQLRNDEVCVCHLETALGYRQAYISQQLGVLRQAGLVTDRRKGWNIYYRVIVPQVFDVMDTVRALAGNAEPPRSPSAHLADCPCPKCHSAMEPA
jgi:ArsR family transcriptional regulator